MKKGVFPTLCQYEKQHNLSYAQNELIINSPVVFYFVLKFSKVQITIYAVFLIATELCSY